MTIGQRIAAAERRTQALQLKKQGYTYDEIAQQLGYAGRQGAFAAVSAALAALPRHDAEAYRTLQLERLDAMRRGLWPGVETGDPSATNAAIKVEEREAKLLGLDAPTKVAPTDPTGERPYASLTDAQLLEQIAAVAALASGGTAE